MAIREQDLRIVTADDELILSLKPIQGLWTEAQYLKLTDHSQRLLEFTDGSIEVLPMPTDRHQVISLFLLFALYTLHLFNHEAEPSYMRHYAYRSDLANIVNLIYF